LLALLSRAVIRSIPFFTASKDHSIPSSLLKSNTSKECEKAIKEELSVVYCRGVKPIRIDSLAPDLALVVISDKKIDYPSLNTASINKVLGVGSFATVHLGVHKGEEVAVKEMNEEAADFAEFRRELWTMRYHISVAFVS